MPIYSYKCLKCEREFDVNKPMAEYDDPQECECGGDTKKLVTFPNIHGLDSKFGTKGWGVAPPANSDKATDKF